ncbi:MAG TPA: PUA domain-containing protein [Candidatus Nanopelagicaceae bacterium]|nr:PUA domain-containing protein [Candidatus Nanopelagicaceae bacterium]
MDIKFILALRKVKAICDYQFGQAITDILFKDESEIQIIFSRNTGKIKHIYQDSNLLLNLRPTNGFFTLSLFSAERIISNTPSPKLRAIVMSEVSEFIRKGRNVFCKHVVDIDSTLRPNDEVIVVNQNNDLLAIGKLVIPVPYVRSFQTGIALKIRKGIGKSKL